MTRAQVRTGMRSGPAFGLGLSMLTAALVAFAVLRWQAPLIATSVVGVPLLVSSRLAGAGMPLRIRWVTAVAGAAMGAGWALVSGRVVAQSYDVPMAEGVEPGHAALEGLAIPVGGALLMLVPAVLARVLDPAPREPSDRYLVGALGAVAFTAAASLTRLAPQLATGPVARDRTLTGLLVEAAIEGLAAPLTAAAAGALFGAALSSRRSVRRVAAAALMIAAGYAVLGLIDVAPLPEEIQAPLHLLVAGAAVLASVRLTGAPVPRRTSARRQALIAGVGVTVASLAAVGVATFVTPVVPRYVCPPDCGRPPIGTPVATNPVFTSSDGAFSVSYPGPGTAYEATLNPDGVVLDFVGGDTGTLELFGRPAHGRTARQIAEDLISDNYPDAVTDYEIPNALVGYQRGYGVVADTYPQDYSGSYTRLRILLMVAVKNDYALAAAAVGPYHRFGPDFGPGHPSGANLQLAIDMGKYVNSFRWGADPQR